MPKHALVATGEALPIVNVTDLPFVKDTRKGGLRRNFWHVQPTGSYADDCETGERYALAYLDYLTSNPDCPGVLQFIVSHMPRDVTGIEVAFLQHLNFAAQAGAWRARQISDFWARKRAEVDHD